MWTDDGQTPGTWGRGPSERAPRTMIGKRGLSRVGTLVLALTLLAAPCAWAAGGAVHDSGSLWTSVETWFQSLLTDWLGAGSGNSTPENTYDRADDTDETAPPQWPTSVGPGDASTTDEGGVPDPNGG